MLALILMKSRLAKIQKSLEAIKSDRLQTLGLLLLFILSSACFFIEDLQRPKILSAVLQTPLPDSSGYAPGRQIDLPFEGTITPEKSLLRFRVSVLVKHYEYLRPFHLTPDDCLRKLWINGVNADLSPLAASDLCNYNAGFNLDLRTYLKTGANELIFEVENTGGPYGLRLDLFSREDSRLSGFLFTLLAILGFAFFLKKVPLGLSRWQRLVLAGSWPYYLFWLHSFSNYRNTNDLAGHLNYIHYLTEFPGAPFHYFGGESFHPPFFYAVAALFYQFFHFLDLDPRTGVRLLSLILYTVFNIFGLKTLGLFQKRREIPETALALIFWPCSILMATRINNDVALYAAWSASFYYLVKWYQDQESLAYRRMFFCLMLAYCIKSNAYLLACVMGEGILLAFLGGRTSFRALCSKSYRRGYIWLILGVFLNYSKNLYFQIFENQNVSALHFGGRGDSVPSLVHFLSFDLGSYLRNPFNILFNEPTFANNLLKTMLYGEFTWQHPLLASLTNGLFLAFLVMIFVNLRPAMFQRQAGVMLCFLSFWACVAGLAVFYAVKKMAVCQDFRFILPCVVPLLVLQGSVLTAARKKDSKFFILLFRTLTYAFLGASCLLFLSQGFYN